VQTDRPVRDLRITEGWKTELRLVVGYISRRFTCPLIVVGLIGPGHYITWLHLVFLASTLTDNDRLYKLTLLRVLLLGDNCHLRLSWRHLTRTSIVPNKCHKTKAAEINDKNTRLLLNTSNDDNF